MARAKAEQIRRRKTVLSDGSILELVIWRVPRPVPGSRHDYKYRLYYGRDGLRLVGYDNERPKGDHRHIGKVEAAYTFSSVETLVRDFLADVEKWRAG